MLEYAKAAARISERAKWVATVKMNEDGTGEETLNHIGRLQAT